MYAIVLSATFALLMFGSAVGLYVRGRKALGIALGLAVIANNIGLQYIIYSPEVRGVDGQFSTLYQIASYATDIGILAQCVIIFVVCWAGAKPQPNPSFNGRRGTGRL